MLSLPTVSTEAFLGCLSEVFVRAFICSFVRTDLVSTVYYGWLEQSPLDSRPASLLRENRWNDLVQVLID